MLKKFFLFAMPCLFLNLAIADTLPIYQTCFTPQQNCIDMLVSKINQAKKSIYVQSYSFTSYDLADALAAAHDRGVTVNIIVDKSQLDPKFRSAIKVNQILKKSNIPVFQDSINGLAHNKVMIIDEKEVETGSFNFTYSAEKYNAENMLIITDADIAKAYLNNWFNRKSQSQLVDLK